MNPKILLIPGLLLAGISLAQNQARSLTTQEMATCKQMKKAGALQAASFLQVDDPSCSAYVNTIDDVTGFYLDQLRDSVSSDTDLSLQCLASGFQDAVVVFAEDAAQTCLNSLDAATLAGYGLGYSSCYLLNETRAPLTFALSLGAPMGNRFDRAQFMIVPGYDQAWIDQFQRQTEVGFLFGCLLGEQDSFAGQAPRLLPASRPDLSTIPTELGQFVGGQWSQAFCPGVKVNRANIEETIPETVRADFLAGFSATLPPACWE
jgi:hypothetical protein